MAVLAPTNRLYILVLVLSVAFIIYLITTLTTLQNQLAALNSSGISGKPSSSVTNTNTQGGTTGGVDTSKEIHNLALCLAAAPNYAHSEACYSTFKHAHLHPILDTLDALPDSALAKFKSLGHHSPHQVLFPTHQCDHLKLQRLGPDPYAKNPKGLHPDGPKWMCPELLEIDKPNDPCVIFSVGSNGDFQFEHAMKKFTEGKCKIYTFDCTGSWSDPTTEFHPWCISDGNYKDEKGREYKTLTEMMKLVGVTKIHLFKIDVEGFEYKALTALSKEPAHALPKQMLLEVHFWDHMIGTDFAPQPNDWMHRATKFYRDLDKMGGAWYDRILGDTPSTLNDRLNYQPLSFFQTDIDLSGQLKPLTGPNITDQFLTQLNESGTDAMAYLTVYPFMGFDAITDDQLSDLAARMRRILESGRSLFLRYAPEMNGTWFPYGQDPAKFKASWIRVITYLRSALGPDLIKRVAFIWAPNSGNGYPYPLPPPEGWSPVNTTAEGQARIRDMDTNGNGILDELDDPYQPYYPGDQYVDWVGISIYHYGSQWPWINNVAPEPNKFEGYLQGNVRPEWGHYPFYTWFSSPTGCNVSTGNKPFFLVETGSTYHYAYTNTTRNPDPLPNLDVSRVTVKQSWWRQFLNVDFMNRFPNIKAVCFFEFVKSEELTERDFTNLGAPPNGFPVENKEVGDAFVRDAREMMPFILWGNRTNGTGAAGGSTGTSATGGAATATVTNRPNAAVGKFREGMNGLGWMAGLLVGNLEIAKELLVDQGVSPNCPDAYGQVPLHWAAFHDHVEIAKLLIDCGAEVGAVDSYGDQPIHACAVGGSMKTLVLLLENYNVPIDTPGGNSRTPLHWACEKGRKELASYLLSQGANPEARCQDGQNTLYYATVGTPGVKGSLEIVKMLVEEWGVEVGTEFERGFGVVHFAAATGSNDVLEYLITQRSVDVNTPTSDGLTPLHLAASKNQLDTAKFLLETLKANPRQPDHAQLQPLHLAAHSGSTDVIRYLVTEWGMDVDTAGPLGSSPFMVACFQSDNLQTLQTLTSLGADPRRKDLVGFEALHAACRAGNFETVRFLVEELKVPVDAEGVQGLTGLEWAVHEGRLECVEGLVEVLGADVGKVDLERVVRARNGDSNSDECIEYIRKAKEGKVERKTVKSETDELKVE
ncbi:hypothetical protein HDV05_000450 [Chytridiales sp. JEL 0842]|nr:hypothetical protein HDV05_000450 [Chytridiales sp. JEL 0842]